MLTAKMKARIRHATHDDEHKVYCDLCSAPVAASYRAEMTASSSSERTYEAVEATTYVIGIEWTLCGDLNLCADCYRFHAACDDLGAALERKGLQ